MAPVESRYARIMRVFCAWLSLVAWADFQDLVAAPIARDALVSEAGRDLAVAANASLGISSDGSERKSSPNSAGSYSGQTMLIPLIAAA